ncbi:hypothetical protein QUB75_19690 [Microcoleus sp. K1-B6]|uniref:hypothetical protein n=1 Tax=Microcoleus sp. K1-B6 TaxID=2818787 RepID=UPI002FD8709B
MPQDVPFDIFFEQIGNTTVHSVLTSTATLPASITPSTFLLSIVDALNKAQDVFNSENGTVPNVATVSARELGPTGQTADGTLQAQIFYTVGGNLTFNPGDAGPIIF